MKFALILIALLLSVTAPAARMQSVVSAEELARQLPCADSLRDQSGGGCLQASSTPALGRLYPLTTDLFVDPISGWLGLGKTNPGARLDVDGGIHLNAELAFEANSDGIRFSSWNPYFTNPVPMMLMFDAGTSNPDRMVLGHSPNYPDYGLSYRDATDAFVFQSSPSNPTLTVDMGSNVDIAVDTRVSGSLRVDAEGLGSALYVTSQHASNLGSVASLIRSSPAVALSEVLSLRAASGSSSNSQLVEGRLGNNTTFRVDVSGEVFSDGGYSSPADFAEMIEVTTGAESVVPGDVVVIDPNHPRSVRVSTEARSTLVMGVYSTKPGFIGSEREWNVPAEPGSDAFLAGQGLALDRTDMANLYDEVPVAVLGIVPTKVSAENGPIRPGDLLVTSSIQGHAMRADRPGAGTILGKALGFLDEGAGVIRVLITLQ